MNLNLGIIGFKRPIFLATNNVGVVVQQETLPPEAQCLPQAAGRLCRNRDAAAILLYTCASHYSHLRFDMPEPKSVTFR